MSTSINFDRALYRSHRGFVRGRRVRAALAALYLRKSERLLAIRGLTGIADMVFYDYRDPDVEAMDGYIRPFEASTEKLLWQVAYGLYRQCIATDHRHLLKRVRGYLKNLGG